MKKIFFLFVVIAVLMIPYVALADPIVPCGNEGQAACTFDHFFVLIENIYNFIVWNIATPLATLVILIGGIMMLLSGINAKWYDTGKNMVKWAIISILLIWSAVLIINTILAVIGARPPLI